MKKLFFLLLPLCFIFSCKDESNSPEISDGKNIYTVEPSSGKLPFPQQHPKFSVETYNTMMKNLWIINNFGMWQGSETSTQKYFHDGLDIVLDNGTRIYAVEDGYVRSIIYGSTLVVEDKDEPGYGWGYTHIGDINVQISENVKQGDFLAKINFNGLAHIHLTRYRLVPGGKWDDFSYLESLLPDKYFDIPDSIPPVIKTPFYFFKNNSDEILDSGQVTPTISGKVDIVVPMRDAGEKYHSISNFGDRVCVNKIEYEIYSEMGIKIAKQSFDFSKITALYNNELYKKVDIAFKSFFRFKPVPPSGDKTFCYYIITNWDENHQLGGMTSADESGCWDTTELNPDGTRKIPNGTYTIKVTAYDFKGNHTSGQQNVKVIN